MAIRCMHANRFCYDETSATSNSNRASHPGVPGLPNWGKISLNLYNTLKHKYLIREKRKMQLWIPVSL